MSIAFKSVNGEEVVPNIGAVIDLAIAPFRTGRIDVFVTENNDDRSRTLGIAVKNLPRHNFTMTLDFMSIVKDPDGGLNRIYQRVFNHYRNRPTISVDDHIILGAD